ncbi:MAG: hypothetical protein U0414_08220 [Polyangiaceae bacterium]
MLTVLLFDDNHLAPEVHTVVSACERVGAVVHRVSDFGFRAVLPRVDVIVGALPRAERRVPKAIVEHLRRLDSDVGVILLAKEPMIRAATWLDGGMLVLLGHGVTLEHLASRLRSFLREGSEPEVGDATLSWSRDARYCALELSGRAAGARMIAKPGRVDVLLRASADYPAATFDATASRWLLDIPDGSTVRASMLSPRRAPPVFGFTTPRPTPRELRATSGDILLLSSTPAFEIAETELGRAAAHGAWAVLEVVRSAFTSRPTASAHVHVLEVL